MNHTTDPHIEKLRHALLQFLKRINDKGTITMMKEVREQAQELPPDVVNALAIEGLHMLGDWVINAMADTCEPERQRKLVEKITGQRVLSSMECFERDFPEQAQQLEKS